MIVDGNKVSVLGRADFLTPLFDRPFGAWNNSPVRPLGRTGSNTFGVSPVKGLDSLGSIK
jgi:hypothetical protein